MSNEVKPKRNLIRDLFGEWTVPTVTQVQAEPPQEQPPQTQQQATQFQGLNYNYIVTDEVNFNQEVQALTNNTIGGGRVYYQYHTLGGAGGGGGSGVERTTAGGNGFWQGNAPTYIPTDPQQQRAQEVYRDIALFGTAQMRMDYSIDTQSYKSKVKKRRHLPDWF